MMTLSERRYYRIATGLSILLHVVLLLVALPKFGWFGPVDRMEMVSAGIVELNPGTPVSVHDSASQNGQPVVASAQPQISELKPKPKPKPKPKQVTPVKPIKQSVVKVKKIKNPPKQQTVKPVEKRPDQKTPKLKPEQAVAKPTSKPTVKTEEEVKEPPRCEPDTLSQTEPENPEKKAQKAQNSDAPQSAAKDSTGKPEANGKKTQVAQKLGSGENMLASGMDVPFYYPKNARNEEKEGDVHLRILLDSNGSFEKLLLIHSAGDSRLDNAAQNYIRRHYKFKPHQDKYYVDLVVSFKISDEAPKIKFLNSETRL
jgi:protein TonB